MARSSGAFGVQRCRMDRAAGTRRLLRISDMLGWWRDIQQQRAVQGDPSIILSVCCVRSNPSNVRSTATATSCLQTLSVNQAVSPARILPRHLDWAPQSSHAPRPTRGLARCGRVTPTTSTLLFEGRSATRFRGHTVRAEEGSDCSAISVHRYWLRNHARWCRPHNLREVSQLIHAAAGVRDAGETASLGQPSGCRRVIAVASAPEKCAEGFGKADRPGSAARHH